MAEHRRRVTVRRRAFAVSALAPTLLVGLLLAGLAHAGGRVKVEVLGHYTDDVENRGEEWTFEVDARGSPDIENKGWGKLSPSNISGGDSNPNEADYRDTVNKVIFDHTYVGGMPTKIYVQQRGWENDRGGRRTFECCSIWNDDDEYHAGGTHIDLRTIETGSPKVVSLEHFSGKRHGIRVRVTVDRPTSGPDLAILDAEIFEFDAARRWVSWRARVRNGSGSPPSGCGAREPARGPVIVSGWLTRGPVLREEDPHRIPAGGGQVVGEGGELAVGATSEWVTLQTRSTSDISGHTHLVLEAYTPDAFRASLLPADSNVNSQCATFRGTVALPLP